MVHPSICPPPLPPSPSPLPPLCASNTATPSLTSSPSFFFLPSLIGSFRCPIPPSRLRCRLSLPSLASEVPSAAHGFPSRLQFPHRIRVQLRPSPLPLAPLQPLRPLFDAHLLLQGSALRVALQDRHPLPLRRRRHTQNPLLPRQRRSEASKSKTKPLKKVSRPSSSSSFRKRPNGTREKGRAGSEDGSEGQGENEREVGSEDEVFDAMTLRKFVKMVRRKANAACADLEKERTAAASSAEEAMAMILRLQNEKSAAEIQATQFRRMAEQKLDYDQEVIESLQWTITQHESQKSELEDQLGFVREELKEFMRDDEMDQLEVEVSKGYTYDDDPDGNSVDSSSETESQTL
ncbi:Myosin-binding protein 2 [Spatholobus suberectus]|nr:Myosin-binding protein 2 [Spatholobus suberectus]